MWALRKGFWNRLATQKFASNKPAEVPVPREEGRKVGAATMASQYPGIPIPNIRVADHVPADEAQPLKLKFYEFQVGMYGVLSPMEDGLPPIDDDPQRALAEAYTEAHRKLFPPPVLPAEYKGRSVDLGRVAVASPYHGYVERAPEGGFQWDLRHLDRYEHHAGLRKLGSRVFFRLDEPGRRLEAVRIDCEVGSCKPGDDSWETAQKIALCALTTDTSLVRHFNWVHLAAGSPLSIATRNSLPANHPLRRLLWPHMHHTQFSNQLITLGQLSEGGDFETTFSFTRAGMCKLMEETYEQFDITVLDPERDAARRGILDAGFDTPALDNRRALFDVFHAHALRYLRAYYDSDEAVRADEAIAGWVEELDNLTPNGVRRYLGNEINVEAVARLIASFIYLATVEHEALGTGLWNYQLWTHVQPARVYANGQREPLDVYQRLVNANFNLNVSRTPLMHDFGYLALDQKGADAFRLFRHDLQKLQERMEQERTEQERAERERGAEHDPTPWKVYPRILEANINA